MTDNRPGCSVSPYRDAGVGSERSVRCSAVTSAGDDVTSDPRACRAGGRHPVTATSPPNTRGRSEEVSGARQRRGALQVTRFNCEGVGELEPHALGITYWFEAPVQGGPYVVTIRFNGRRIGVKGRPGRRDTFEAVETVERVQPGMGSIAVTRRVSDVAPGEWHVTATATAEAAKRAGTGSGRAATRLPGGSTSGPTTFAPIVRVRAPGARLGAWPALVGVGVVCALVVQWLLVRRAHLPAGKVLAISLAASLVGLVGAKVYYLVEHRRERPAVLTAGMCIQGFVLAAIVTLVAAAAAFDIAVGRVLDASTPGLLFAMSIGRWGCFLGGCCAGRPTASRWGLWSSDRHLGVRRIPTQLLESGLAFGIGAAALAVVTARSSSAGGWVFVGGIAAYTLGRQLLFPLRELPRNTSHGRRLTMAIAGAVLLAAVAVVAVR